MLVRWTIRLSRSRWICRTCARQLSTGYEPPSPPGAMIPLRTRFAPSPTGHLHLGSLRTALFNFLAARKSGGQFILRVEDTDQKRTVEGAEKRMYEDLKWAGLEWDEGPDVGGPYGPYKQSERLSLYRQEAERLLESRHAYRCFCASQQDHETARRMRMKGDPTDYATNCRGLDVEQSRIRAAQGDRFLVRLKASELRTGWEDMIFNKKSRHRHLQRIHLKPAEEKEDPVLVRADGTATYPLASVVDDHYMKINLVIRGAEWLTFTPTHVQLYSALDWTPPRFAHVGLLVDQTGEKLSKRTKGIDLKSFRDKGVLPEALVNYVALLGWSHNSKSDVMTLPTLIKRFTFAFTRNNTIVSLEKLWFLQKAHAQIAAETGSESIARTVESLYQMAIQNSLDEKLESFLKGKDLREHIEQILRANLKNYTRLDTFFEQHLYFFGPVINSHYHPYTIDNRRRHEVPNSELVVAAEAVAHLGPDEWTSERIKKMLQAIVIRGSQSAPPGPEVLETVEERRARVKRQKAYNVGFHHYLRWALAEDMKGPSVADIMLILGRDETLARIKTAVGLTRVDGSEDPPKFDVAAADATESGMRKLVEERSAP